MKTRLFGFLLAACLVPSFALAWDSLSPSTTATSPLSVANGGMPVPSASGNMTFDDGTTWQSLAPGGDLIPGGTLGQFFLAGQEGIPYTGSALSTSVAGEARCTDGSGHMVVCTTAADPGTTIGDMLSLSATGTPNTYARIPTGGIGQVLSGRGTGLRPDFEANESPLYISFDIPGAVANSTNRWKVCPRTVTYAPGLIAASGTAPYYVTVDSAGIAGTAPSAIDTYTFQDAGTTMAFGYLQPTTGVMNFGTPLCSPNFDGTQGSTAFNRATTVTTVAVTIPAAAASTDEAILACNSNQTSSSFSAPTGVTGWSAVTGGNHSGAGLSTQLYELNPIGANAGASVSCNYGASGTMTAGVWTFKNGPASGEVVDAIAITHNAAATTSAFPAVTPTLPGDTIFVAQLTTSAATFSAPPSPYTLGNTSNGIGSIYMFGGAASASASGSDTVSTSAITDSYAIALKSGQTTCTLCTKGDKLEMQGPATAQSEADVNAVLGGVK